MSSIITADEWPMRRQRANSFAAARSQWIRFGSRVSPSMV